MSAALARAAALGILRSDLLAALAVGAALLAASAVAGPVVAAGGTLALAAAFVVYHAPMVGLAAMLLAGTALQVLGSEHITGLPVSLGKAAGALTLAAWGARALAQGLPLTYSPQLLALLAFAASVFLAGFVAPDPAEAREGLFRYAQLLLLFLMIAAIAGESARRLDAACAVLTAAMALSALIGLAEFFVPSLALDSDDPALVQGSIGAIVDRDSLDGVEIKRITGGLSDSNWFAYTLACVLPLNLYLFRRHASAPARLALLGAAGLQGVGVVLSYTRSALVAAVVVVGVLLLRRRLPLGPLLAAAVLGAAALAAWSPAGLQRVFSVEYAREGSTPLRTWLLLGGVSLVAERPVSGYGYNGFGPAFADWLAAQPDLDESVATWERELERRVAAGEERYEWVMPHNTAIQVWVEFGLLGLLAFSAFLLALLRDLRVARRFGDDGHALLSDCLLAGALGFLACAAFGHLALLKLVWILGGLAAALRRVALTDAAARAGGPGG